MLPQFLQALHLVHQCSLSAFLLLLLSVNMPLYSRNGSTWLASCVLWVEYVYSSAAPLVQPPTAHLWAPWVSASTLWSPWAPVRYPILWPPPLPVRLQPPARHPWAASWIGCWPCWCAAMTGSASTFAPMSKTCWGWSWALHCTPCSSTSWGTASANSLTRRDRWVDLWVHRRG